MLEENFVCMCVRVFCVDTRRKPWVLYLRSCPSCLLRQSLSLARGSPSNLDPQARDLKGCTSPVLRLAVCTTISDLILCGFWGSV